MIDFGKNNAIRTPPFLVSLADINAGTFKNMLKIVIALPKYGKPGEGISAEEDKIFKNAVPIYADNNEMYEIIFEDYIVYRSTNDYYSKKDDNAPTGRYLVVYKKSDFLKSNLEMTIAKGYAKLGHIAEPVHYGIYTESHLIDVISYKKPTIVKV